MITLKDEETEAQKGEDTCSGSHSWKWQTQDWMGKLASEL